MVFDRNSLTFVIKYMYNTCSLNNVQTDTVCMCLFYTNFTNIAE